MFSKYDILSRYLELIVKFRYSNYKEVDILLTIVFNISSLPIEFVL